MVDIIQAVETVVPAAGLQLVARMPVQVARPSTAGVKGMTVALGLAVVMVLQVAVVPEERELTASVMLPVATVVQP